VDLIIGVIGLSATIVVMIASAAFGFGKAFGRIQANAKDLILLRQQLNGNLKGIKEELKDGSGELRALREGVNTLKEQVRSIEEWCRER